MKINAKFAFLLNKMDYLIQQRQILPTSAKSDENRFIALISPYGQAGASHMLRY